MASLVALGLALDLVGTLFVVLPRTRFRRAVERLPLVGPVEQARRTLYHDRGELTADDPGFERVVAILQRQSGETADPYKISTKPDKTRLHVALNRRAYIEPPDETEQWVETYVNRLFLVVGLALIALGVALQILAST